MATNNVDITLEKDSANIYDLQIDSGDLVSNTSFETAIQMSLLTDIRADSSEVPTPERRRGWWGNVANRTEDYNIGSKLWLLDQARNTEETLNLAIDYARNSLQWLIDDNEAENIEVTGQRSGDTIRLNIVVSRSQSQVESFFFDLWQNTKVI